MHIKVILIFCSHTANDWLEFEPSQYDSQIFLRSRKNKIVKIFEEILTLNFAELKKTICPISKVNCAKNRISKLKLLTRHLAVKLRNSKG